jgi:hypothetical protein
VDVRGVAPGEAEEARASHQCHNQLANVGLAVAAVVANFHH